MVTSHDVARLAGVSQPTVSRALRGNPEVSAETRERVEQAARQLGYVPSAAGRALSLGRSQRVGVHVADFSNQFYPHVMAPLHRAFDALGYDLVLVSESGRMSVDERAAALGLDGLVLATMISDSDLPDRLRKRRVPFVYFNRVGSRVDSDTVMVDPAPGLRAAVDRAVELGHRRIGLITGEAGASTAVQREAVIRAALTEHGLEIRPELTRAGRFDVETGLAATDELMQSADPPTLIFCANDAVAIGACNTAAGRGLVVGRDLSLVGFDNLPEGRWPMLDLATVRFDLPGMIRATARLLTERIEAGDRAPYDHVVFPSEFIERSSLGPAPR